MKHLVKTITLSLLLISSTTLPMRSGLSKTIFQQIRCMTITKQSAIASQLRKHALETNIPSRDLRAAEEAYNRNDIESYNKQLENGYKKMMAEKDHQKKLQKKAIQNGLQNLIKNSYGRYNFDEIDPKVLHQARLNIGPNPYLKEIALVANKGDFVTAADYLKQGYDEALYASVQRELSKIKK